MGDNGRRIALLQKEVRWLKINQYVILGFSALAFVGLLWLFTSFANSLSAKP